MTERDVPGFHRVIVGRDAEVGYHGIIAIHDIRRGPALGGTRMMAYESEDTAIRDVLRLAYGMSLKSAFAAMPFGGGKAVIMAPRSPADRAALLRAHGRFVNTLRGDFITGEDVGTTVADMTWVREETEHVLTESAVSVDSARTTALGVFRSMEGALRGMGGSSELRGRRVAIQGCGAVGSALCELLHDAGAELSLSDVVAERAESCASAAHGRVVATDDILREPVDILSPCALGAILDARSVEAIRAPLILGAANNQLADDSVADRLHARGLRYVPDFVANAGGVIAAAPDLLGWTRAAVYERIDAMRDEVISLCEEAQRAGYTMLVVAMRRARERMKPT